VSDPAPDDPEVPGLAGARTDLAWSRSGLAIVVAGAAIVRRVADLPDEPAGRSAVFAVLGVGAAAWVLALWWGQYAARSAIEGGRVSERHRLLSVTVGTVAFAFVALVLSVAPRNG
jgi:uncharacterized membrane protein YidH (DUF202 family)